MVIKTNTFGNLRNIGYDAVCVLRMILKMKHFKFEL